MVKKPKEQEMGQKRYEISDEQWEQIKDIIQHSKMGRPPKDDRLMLNAIFWIARSGARWSDLPERFGSYKTVYSRFCKWRDDGTLYRIFRKLNAKAELKELNIDSTSVKAHPQSAGAKKGCKCGKQAVYRQKPRRKEHENPCSGQRKRSDCGFHLDRRSDI